MTPIRKIRSDDSGCQEAAAKPLRADARRNRARILVAAEAVFTAQGPSASTEEVAREAGVGIGTVFRHFPTKEALLEAIVVGRLRQLVDEAEALSTADDPGEALFALCTRAVEEAATKMAFAEALVHAGVDVHSVTAQVKRELHDTVGALLARAQRAGTVRDDVGVTELLALVIGISRAIDAAGGDRNLQARTLAIMVDGLRAPAGRRLK